MYSDGGANQLGAAYKPPNDLLGFAHSEALPANLFDRLLADLLMTPGVDAAELNLVIEGVVVHKAFCGKPAKPAPPAITLQALSERAPVSRASGRDQLSKFHTAFPVLTDRGDALGALVIRHQLDLGSGANAEREFPMAALVARWVVALIERAKAVADLEMERSILAATEELLAMIVGGVALSQILNELAEAVQASTPNTICSVSLLDEQVLRHGSAPDLPPNYWHSIDNLPIGPEAGSCGTAAFTGRPVIVSDIAADRRWDNYRHLALAYGLRACWSIPIARADGVVLGTFALYYRDVREPSTADLNQMKRWANLAEVAISRVRDVESLRAAALVDPLTGLANRTQVERQLQEATRAQTEELIAVHFVDLDQFKFVNDTLGHAIGDTILKIVAERLLDCAGTGDTVARLGGDEFIVLCRGVQSVAYAEAMAYEILAAVQAPMQAQARSISLSASVGLSLHKTGLDGETPDLIGDADLAMYAAKQAGRRSVAVFTPSMRAEVQERFAVEAELSRAIGTDEIRCVYQPIVDLSTGRVVGAEALVRWMSPTRGEVPSTMFIPVAQESGLIGELGDLVLSQACQQLRQWREGAGTVASPYDSFTMWVNVTVRQLAEVQFVDRLLRVLEENGLVGADLGLEVTESIFGRKEPRAHATLTQLRGRGVRIAIDDFGAGHSSLAQLKHLPIDTLKIDQQFIDGLGVPDQDGGANGANVVQAMVALATSRGLQAVAEGIESQAQADVLLALGCSYGQGQLWSKPVDAARFTNLFPQSAWPSATGR